MKITLKDGVVKELTMRFPFWRLQNPSARVWQEMPAPVSLTAK